MRRRLAATLAVAALLAGACGSDDDSSTPPTTGGSGAGGQTFTIGVDARTEGFASSWVHFFPHEVEAHPGDTLVFASTFTGEPHSVAIGSLIDEALQAYSRIDKNSDQPPPPEIQAVLDKVPFVFSESPDAGPDDFFVQAAAQPCYLPENDPPTDQACPKADQKPPHEITGKERFLSSGFLADEQKATFRLAADMAPGTYAFMCLVHGPEMTEVVKVVDKATKVPGPDEVEAMGRMHLDEFVAKVKADVDKVQTSTAATAPAGGFPSDKTVPSAGVNVFPKEIAVKVGEKVTWTVDGFHTIAFNAPEDARPWVQFDDSGVLVVNKKAYTPAASPDIPAPPARPEGSADDGPPPKLPVDAGTWDGQGFHSSGAPFSEGQLEYSLAFAEPGTFKYLCLIHPDMEGTVKVS